MAGIEVHKIRIKAFFDKNKGEQARTEIITLKYGEISKITVSFSFRVLSDW